VVTPVSNLEREVKLDVGLRFELPDLNEILPGIVASPLPTAELRATYIDTADLRLMRWGVTLRHRQDAIGGAGAESEWTVKLPGEADGVAMVRTELSWPGEFGPLPAEVANLVRAHARRAPLEPVAELVSERTRVELFGVDGRKVGEIDDDVVSVMKGGQLTDRFRQVELELTEAATHELMDAVLQALTNAGAVSGDDRPKVVRAIGPRASLGPDVVVPALTRHSDVATVVAAAIGAGVTRIIRHDPGIRLGDDPEHVHQARVGTRRLRSDLRTFRRLLDPEWAALVRAELGWLAAALGEVRDADVLTARLRDQIRTLPGTDTKGAAGLLRRLAAQREEARVRLVAALDTERYLALLDNLVHASAQPPLLPKTPGEGDGEGETQGEGDGVAEGATPGEGEGEGETPGEGDGVAEGATPGEGETPGEGHEPLAEVLRPLIRRPWKRLRRLVKHLGDDPPDEALHEIRIAAKRLRYAAEAVAGVIGPAAKLASTVADLQTELGDLHDAVVAETWLRRQAATGPTSQALVAGELIALQRQAQAECRAHWPKPWKRVAKQARGAWLKS